MRAAWSDERPHASTAHAGDRLACSPHLWPSQGEPHRKLDIYAYCPYDGCVLQKGKIWLVAIGAVPANLLDGLTAPLSVTFGRPCEIGAPAAVPRGAFDQRRNQYPGNAILSTLARLEAPDAERVLGVIDADCYAPGLNFIFGQAGVDGRSAFVAVPRLRQAFYSLREDEPLFHQRALKEAIHELGHTYGLQHCSNPRCVMHFSNSLYDTDFKSVTFCFSCNAQLERTLAGE